MNISLPDHTKRLILRTSDESEAADVLDFYQRNSSDIEKTEPISFRDFYTLRFHRTVLKTERTMIERGQMLRFWLYLSSDPKKLIGTISFHNIRRGDFSDASVGYKIDSSFRRKGYCREALLTGIDFMMSDLCIHRLYAYVLPDNAPSINLLTSLGFVREGLLRNNIRIAGQFKSHYIYSLIQEDLL